MKPRTIKMPATGTHAPNASSAMSDKAKLRSGQAQRERDMASQNASQAMARRSYPAVTAAGHEMRVAAHFLYEEEL